MDSDWRLCSHSELEKQVSHSLWIPERSYEVIDEYNASSIELTKLARESIPNNLDIAYGPLPSQKFDLYGTDLSENSPILFYIHGGYWQGGSKDTSGISPHLEGSKDTSGISPHLFLQREYKTVVFGYTLAPGAKIKNMEEELISCLKVLNKMYPNAILIVAEHQAGAHLASSLLHSASLPREVARQIFGLILISGVYDLRPLVHTYVNQKLDMWPPDAESLSTLLLPFNNIISFSILKILVLVGGYDSPEFQRQSLEYYEKLKERAQQTSLYKLEMDNHFTIVQNLANHKSVFEFLREFL